MWHRVDTAANTVGHCAGLATKRWPAIDRVIFNFCPDCHSYERQVEHRGGQHGGVTVVAAGQAPHHDGGASSIVFRPPICRVRVKDIDASWKLADLAFERDGSSAMPFADFEAEQ